MLKLDKEVQLVLIIDTMLALVNMINIIDHKSFIVLKVISGAIIIIYAWKTGVFG